MPGNRSKIATRYDVRSSIAQLGLTKQEEKEMSEIKVKSGREEGATTVTVNYDIPGSVSEAISKYGENTVYDLLSRALTLGVQALVRVKMGKGETDQAALQAAVDNWTPGVRGPVTRQTPLERASSALKGMTPEQLAELLAKVKAQQKAAHGG
jgi:hypothetical protein